MSSALLPWQEDFRRECGIRRGVILHGNTGDLTSDPEAPGQWTALPTALMNLLRQRGYQHVVFWNRVNGVSGVDARTWGELQSSVTPPAARESTSEGNAYDMGDLPPTPVASPASNGITASADDLLTVAAQWLRQPRAEKSVAFVLDWTQYLFGSVNSLSENERGWLLRLGQATRDAAVVRNAESIGQPQSLLVLLCGGLNVLPPSLYLNNPLFREIAIPLPTRQVRESAVLGLKEVFRLQPPLQQGGRELADFVDGLEGQSIRDIHNLARLSRQETEVSSACLYSIFIATDADTVLGNNWITKNFRPLSKPWGVGSKVKGKQLNRYGASSCVPSRGCRGFNTRTGNALPRACCFLLAQLVSVKPNWQSPLPNSSLATKKPVFVSTCQSLITNMPIRGWWAHLQDMWVTKLADS